MNNTAENFAQKSWKYISTNAVNIFSTINDKVDEISTDAVNIFYTINYKIDEVHPLAWILIGSFFVILAFYCLCCVMTIKTYRGVVRFYSCGLCYGTKKETQNDTPTGADAVPLMEVPTGADAVPLMEVPTGADAVPLMEVPTGADAVPLMEVPTGADAVPLMEVTTKIQNDMPEIAETVV